MDAPPPNPFEPPRSDLDGGKAAATGPVLVADEALEELAAAAPWVRRLTRVMVLSIGVQLFTSIAVVQQYGFAWTKLATLVGGVTIAISALFLVVLRRYAAASERFRDGDDEAIGPLLAAQALYFKLVAGLAAIGLTVYIVWLAVGIASGRWLAWVRA